MTAVDAWASREISGGRPISPSPTNRNTGGSTRITIPAVTSAFSRNANRRRARYELRSCTSAVAADSSIMIGDSMTHARETATPKAARLCAVSGIRATNAAI
jgi:hypothetical protein